MNRFTVLITQPDFDKTTRYVSAWSEEVEEFASSIGGFLDESLKDKPNYTFANNFKDWVMGV